MNIEKVVEALSNSVSNVDLNLEQVLADPYCAAYLEATMAIVEPKGVDDEYYEWMDNDLAGWVGFIGNILGSEWQEVARLVEANGY